MRCLESCISSTHTHMHTHTCMLRIDLVHLETSHEMILLKAKFSPFFKVHHRLDYAILRLSVLFKISSCLRKSCNLGINFRNLAMALFCLFYFRSQCLSVLALS